MSQDQKQHQQLSAGVNRCQQVLTSANRCQQVSLSAGVSRGQQMPTGVSRCQQVPTGVTSCPTSLCHQLREDPFQLLSSSFPPTVSSPPSVFRGGLCLRRPVPWGPSLVP